MKNKIIKASLIIGFGIFSLGLIHPSDDWGFFGHRRINRMAVFTLPPEMIGFYKKNIEFITEHAVDPDKRRYATRHEAVRHYIDLDAWGKFPFDNLPRDWVDALMKYTDVYAVQENGDTLHLFGQSIMSRIKLTQNEHENTYKSFFIQHILPEYYEDEWNIDCDTLNSLLANPVPCQKAFAVDRFSENGILPYNLLRVYKQLVQAFVEKREQQILRLSTEIGHYIGDAHVPLHTTENYNGQLTDQVGIHGFWESRLPELYADSEYDFFVGKAEYITDPKTYFWEIVLQSHVEVDSVLQIEKELSKVFRPDQQFCYEERLGQTIRTYCQPYAAAYHERLAGMVERRMCQTVKALGNIWYSAWIDAGQPDLRQMLGEPLSKQAQKESEELESQVKKGEIKGRAHPDEGQ
jgi:hypothetical protein